MKFFIIALSTILAVSTTGFCPTKKDYTKPAMKNAFTKEKDSVLRHVVLFKFKDGTTSDDIKKVEDAFGILPSKIPQITSYEWGLNNSPEGLDKGFTHCFLLTFKSEEDRAIYLPHPDHKAFGQVLTPFLDDVLVIDYWSN
ncbi:MAG: Dabb family protein [Maribacter sp.]|nr:Dabb family protein [Maribacter sp.]MBT8312900.1 Dabb family protein [Maribacter sp.]